VSLKSKQASSENGSFYVLQCPNSKAPAYHIGELFLEESSTEGRLGFFKTYDTSREQSLGAPKTVLTTDQLISYLKTEASAAELRLSPNFGEEKAYAQTFSKIKKMMLENELKKAVLFSSAVVKDVDFPSKSDFFAYSLRLLENQKSGFLFGFYNPKSKQAYLGLSPEFLCREIDGLKYTTAVAGTKSEADFQGEWSDKLTQEHELVKKGIALNYEVEWSKTAVQEYGEFQNKLRHLKAEGLLKTNDSVEKISSVLHPTSAVGTLPKTKSRSYKLGDMSHQERGHFGGYAYLNQAGEPFSLVTIRGVEWSDNRSFVCIGGGVLAESVLSDEWSELENKWRTFKSLWRIET
jgi:isochorismate synthase EntC